MEAESSGRSSSIDEEEEEEQEDEEVTDTLTTFFDFESEVSVPNTVVKSFLRDCHSQPKILCHKDFHFFRSYLKEVGLKFVMPDSAPYREDHEDYTVCVELDDDWMDDLKERLDLETESSSYYWASFRPLTKKSNLGLAIFEWKLQPLSMAYLQVYIDCCRSSTKGTSEALLDDYVVDFLEAFQLDRNWEVEGLHKDDLEAARLRQLRNQKEPEHSDELDRLLKVTPMRNRSISISPTKHRKENKRRRSSSTDSSRSESKSTSSRSSESVHSEYNGRCNVQNKRHKDQNKSKPNGAVEKTPVKVNGAMPKLNGKFEAKRSNSPKTSTKSRSAFTCETCKTRYATLEDMDNHLSHTNPNHSGRSLARCKCGSKVTFYSFESHITFCSMAR